MWLAASTHEADETVGLSLSNPVSATVGGNSPATLTIIDDDPAPTVDFDAASYTVDEAAGTATITVTLSAAAGITVTVNYATADGTALTPGDPTPSSNSLQPTMPSAVVSLTKW